MSTSTIVARPKVTGQHVLKIHGYSHMKALVATGEHIQSSGFRVGGRTWRITYYPNGKAKGQADWIAVGLNAEPDAAAIAMKAWFRFSTLDMDGEPVPAYTQSSSTIREFPSPGRNDGWVFPCFLRRVDLESSAYLRNDGFAIRCDIDAMIDLALRVDETFLDVPEPDLHVHLADLLHTKEGADVEFKAGDETFAAHRCILAARSPVFKAELSVSRAGTYVNIADMDAPTFRAFLSFIYTDSLPEKTVPAVARQLLAAAVRYQVARLKLVCEDKLSRSLDKTMELNVVDSAAATAQPRRHHGTRKWLMGLCLGFLNLLRPRCQQPQCSLHSMPTSVGNNDDATPPSSASIIVISETTGHHVLRIDGYTRTRMMLAYGQYFCSGEFQVGGHTWRLKYYPNGNSLESTSYISMRLESTSIGTTDDDDVVHGKVELSISLPGQAGEPIRLCTFYDDKATFTKHDTGVSIDKFVTRTGLEGSRFLKDDCFTVRCDLTVFVKEVRAEPLVKVPPPVLPKHLCQLLYSHEGSDVSFKVGRESIAAHRCILAARSSVFKAELLGPMREHQATCIRIDDMDACVFRALLHFIYTDELSTTTQEEATTMAQHLLVAADRYGMERLKLVCEDKLCRHLDTRTAATTLALAEQHQCPRLKEAVLAFLCSSTANLRAVVASDGYEHLTKSCPSVTKELVARLAAAR